MITATLIPQRRALWCGIFINAGQSDPSPGLKADFETLIQPIERLDSSTIKKESEDEDKFEFSFEYTFEDKSILENNQSQLSNYYQEGFMDTSLFNLFAPTQSIDRLSFLPPTLNYTMYYRGQTPKQNYLEQHCYCVFNYFLEWDLEQLFSLTSQKGIQLPDSRQRYAMHVALRESFSTEPKDPFQTWIIMSNSKTTGKGRIQFDKENSSYYTGADYQLQFTLKDSNGTTLADTYSTSFKLLTRKPNNKRYKAHKPFGEQLNSLLKSAPTENHQLHALSLLKQSLTS